MPSRLRFGCIHSLSHHPLQALICHDVVALRNLFPSAIDPLERAVVYRRELLRSRLTRCRIARPILSAFSACSAFQICSAKRSLDNRSFASAYRRRLCFSCSRKRLRDTASVVTPVRCEPDSPRLRRAAANSLITRPAIQCSSEHTFAFAAPTSGRYNLGERGW